MTSLWTPRGEVALLERPELPGIQMATPRIGIEEALKQGFQITRHIDGARPLVPSKPQYVAYRDKSGRIRPLLIPTIAGGAAGAWTFTNGGRTSLIDGTFDINTDDWWMALYLSNSNIGAASTTIAGVTNQHAAANGYSSGGIDIALTLSGTTTVTVDIATDPVWTASGGSITARFAVIYELSGNVLCYALLDNQPQDVTATDGNTLTVGAHASGVFTLA